jgi:hypothetical protein
MPSGHQSTSPWWPLLFRDPLIVLTGWRDGSMIFTLDTQ